MAEVDFYRKVENTTRFYAPMIRGWLQSGVKSSGLQVATSMLSKSFQERVMKDGVEVWAVKFRAPKYGFIQNFGMEAKRITRGDSSYEHPGFKSRSFIAGPVEKGSILLRDRISIISRDMVIEQIGESFDL